MNRKRFPREPPPLGKPAGFPLPPSCGPALYDPGVRDWVIWMIAAGVLAVGEVATVTFVLGPVALATVLAAIVALIGPGVEYQVLAFAVGSVASLWLIRPIARKHLRSPHHTRTGTAALVGGKATVLERVDATGGTVKLGGEVWSARAYNDNDVLEPGAQVTVVEIRGATALVSD